MLAVTRERLTEHLQQASALVDAYARHDHDYPRLVLAWMTEVEDTLGELRSPLRSMVVAERGKVTAVEDGLRLPEILRDRASARKAMRATASLSLAHVEEALRAEIDAIDRKLDEMRERMLQLMAIATNSHPIPLPITQPKQAWLRKVWAGLAGNGETRSLYTYLNAALATADRTYLLDELLRNLLEAQTPPLSSISFFSESDVARLEEGGFDTLEKLLTVASTGEGKRAIERFTGRERAVVRGWVKRLGLMRLPGIGAEDADLLVRCGVASIADLRRRNAIALVEKIREVAGSGAPTVAVPNVEKVESWLRQAKGS
jgi:hypothetical protein